MSDLSPLRQLCRHSVTFLFWCAAKLLLYAETALRIKPSTLPAACFPFSGTRTPEQVTYITCCSITACCCWRRAWSCWGDRTCCWRICCICWGVITWGVIMATDTGTLQGEKGKRLSQSSACWSLHNRMTLFLSYLTPTAQNGIHFVLCNFVLFWK